jgi:hypothetical protein
MSHRYGDERMADWLQENEYHPRSPKHGSASCLFFLDDLLYESDVFRETAENGDVVYQEDYTVGTGDSKWNTDLVIGPPSGDVQAEISTERAIAEAEPNSVWLAIDAKSVMTEHGKARRNRQRDINSFADIMHSHHPGSTTGGILLINMADRFNSPLRDDDDITEHDRITDLVAETVDIFRDIDRAQGEVSPNVDAVTCVVVDHTNLEDGSATELVTEPPAPQPGDIAHYRTFLEIITETFEDRWLRGDSPALSGIPSTDLRAKLNQQVIETARAAHDVGVALAEDSLDEATLAELQEKIRDLEQTADEIKREHR